MSKLMINDRHEVEGEFTFQAHYEVVNKLSVMTLEGTLEVDEVYLGNIDKIESENYAVKGVHVHDEEYGTATGKIAYYFSAKEYAMARKDITEND